MTDVLAATLAALVLGTPLVGLLVVLAPFLLDWPLEEPALYAITRAVTRTHLAGAVGLLGVVAAAGPCVLDLGRWYGDAEYALHVRLAVDGESAAAAAVVALVGLVVLRFSERYLHQDPAVLRFFATSLLSLACLDLIALAADLDILFVGWELLGLCSFLLVAFFHQRQETVLRAKRTIFSYRVADLGLLLALVLAHAARTPVALGPSGGGAPALATATGLLLLLTATGKSGLPPFSRWLSRSVEGPTPSSALFYAGLSVHAGPWLLLRAWPAYAESPAARAALVAVGLLGAASQSAHASTRSDAKGAVVVAGGAQLGLIVAEIGLGLHGLARLHLLGNLGLRTWQLLRAPSVLAATRRREALVGRPYAAPWTVPAPLWAWSSEGWFEPVADLLVGVTVGAAARLDRWSRRLEALATGGRDEEPR